MDLPEINSEWFIAGDETGNLRMQVLELYQLEGVQYIIVQVWNRGTATLTHNIPISQFWEGARSDFVDKARPIEAPQDGI